MLMNESLREENTTRVDKSRINPKLPQFGISLVKVDIEDGVNQLSDDHRVLLSSSTEEAGVGELIQAGRLAAGTSFPFLLVKEQIVPP